MTKDQQNKVIFSCASCDKEISRYDDKYNDGFCDDCYKEEKQFKYKLGQNHTLQYTPEHIVKDIINNIPIQENDSVLDPFYGDGVFFNNFPKCNKDFCETEKGLDFFDYNKKVDWIISNPPFRVFQDDKKLNGFPLIMDKSTTLANKGIAYLINWKIWNALTIPRLIKWQPFNITKIKIYQIKEWFGRYYLIVFEKKEGIIDF